MANCVGFIDVNGPNSPNKEVTCKNADDTALNPSATCAPASAIGDVFPIVFHDGIVEPASNAAKAVLSAGKGNPAAGDDSGDSSASSPEPKRITYNNQEYEFKSGYFANYNSGSVQVKGKYLQVDENGNLIDGYKTYTRQEDGTYKSGSYVYDKDLNLIGVELDDGFHEAKGYATFAKLDDNDNYIVYEAQGGGTPRKQNYWVKQDDGTYIYNNYVRDKDFNLLGVMKNGELYKAMNCIDNSHPGCTFVKEINNNGDLEANDGYYKYIRQEDGTYKENSGGRYTGVYLDSNLKPIYKVVNNETYNYYNGIKQYIKSDGNGNYVNSNNSSITRGDDGYYHARFWDWSGNCNTTYVLDDDLNPITANVNFWDD